MARGQRMPWERKKVWPAGEYTLLADSHEAGEGVAYSKGDTIALSEREATRLGNNGAIASPDSMHAVRARVESGRGTKRDEYLYEMWKLTGALGDRARF